MRDSVVVTKDGTIAEIIADTTPFRAHPLLLEGYQPDIPIRLPWDVIGGFEYGGLDYDNVLNIGKEDVKGKAAICGEIVTTWEKGWFMSKFDD